MVDDTWELFLHFPHTVRQINATPLLLVETLTALGHCQKGWGAHNESIVSGLPFERQPEAISEQKQDLEFLTSPILFL